MLMLNVFAACADGRSTLVQLQEIRAFESGSKTELDPMAWVQRQQLYCTALASAKTRTPTSFSLAVQASSSMAIIP